MALPSSGSISAALINTELQRGASVPFSMNGTAERALAGKASGAISFSDFLGKSSEIVKTLSAGGTAITLESLFTTAEWASATAKRVVLPAGVERGNSVDLAAAVSIGPTAWGGSLTFEWRGTISGKGGAANSGNGGNAFNANRLGASSQKIIIVIYSGGLGRGGGGGGGLGGVGGNGSTTSTVREPASGYNISDAYRIFWFDYPGLYWGNSNTPIGQAYYYGGVIYGGETAGTIGGWEYIWGTYQGGDDMYSVYSVARRQTTTASTTGGPAGGGGQGEGYGQSRGNGVAGTAGGTNAGTGGTGGNGGLYGASGSTGATGTNGTVTNGVAGTAGGLAGYALENASNANLTNNGSLLGRT